MPAALALPDTDWHLEPLYDFLDALGASVLDSTGLVPVDSFHREALYLRGEAPEESEVRARRVLLAARRCSARSKAMARCSMAASRADTSPAATATPRTHSPYRFREDLAAGASAAQGAARRISPPRT